ncbi:MAG: trypsin-like peptidase domain-containing protein [Oscillatoria sp. SIO1A7]|nr:trypsin-like peptidase domain-containing protein [Oscillatoria sp. SIO1A7]
MTPEELQQSLVLISSSEQKNNDFGTGFVFRQNRGSVYILTCAHVVRDVGGRDKVKIGDRPVTVVATGDENGLDLAVLRVDGLFEMPALNLLGTGNQGSSFITAGFQVLDDKHLIRSLRVTLGDRVGLQSRGLDRIQAWDLQIQDYALKRGYSGSPVVDPDSGNVIAVVIQRQQDGKRGLAICIKALDRICQIVDSDRLYHNLLKLGYRQQVRLFRKLIGKHSVAGFLIHGLPSYGQRWLLNRLLVQHVPDCFRGKPVKINLARKVRKNDVDALWRELGSWVGLRGKERVPRAIVERVYQWWQSQDILLIFHDVDCLPPKGLEQLIQDFWLPLATKVRDSQVEAIPYKLLMFLVDYQGITASWDVPLTDKIDKMDASWQPYTPIEVPKLTKFSDSELTDWMEDEMPAELSEEMERVVEEIIYNSDGGIPELTLEEICHLCDIDWYGESEKWLKF